MGERPEVAGWRRRLVTQVHIPNPLDAADKAMVFADRLRPGNVYVAMRNWGFGLSAVGNSGDGELLFSRSTDGGHTFTASVLEATDDPALAPYDSQLSETRDGTLVYTYDDPAGGSQALRSKDGGVHWSAPIDVAPQASNPQPTVCGNSLATRADGGHDAVIDGKTIALVRVDNGQQGTGPGRIELSKSDDGGLTWITSVVVRSDQPILEAQVAANPQGQLGVTYYQLNLNRVRCNSNAGAVIPTQTRVIVSNDGGGTWSGPEVIGARWWNVAAAGADNDFVAYWVGEYFGMAGTPHGFAVASVQGPPIDRGPGRVPRIIGDDSLVVAEVAAG